ncbi:Zn-ribbon domain-containing OB-fold protein [Candidatus Poriferisocius sp.]|uniref:Zn-ribbon domain-containing OB-fold protein n=1 Tax=Candidatus Poriferisocius sp. TaxID=3101276 RepID=UPI003B58F032
MSAGDSPPTRIEPQRGHDSDEFWDGARRRELLIQGCGVCGTKWHPPSPICPECHSFEVQWVQASGRGHVYSYVVVRHAAHPLVESWVPYNIALIALDEGPRIVSTIRGIRHEDLVIGMPVNVAYEDVTDSFTLPVFEPRPQEY